MSKATIPTAVTPQVKRPVPVDVYDAAVRVYVRGDREDMTRYHPAVRAWVEGRWAKPPAEIGEQAYWVICAAINDGVARPTAN